MMRIAPRLRTWKGLCAVFALLLRAAPEATEPEKMPEPGFPVLLLVLTDDEETQGRAAFFPAVSSVVSSLLKSATWDAGDGSWAMSKDAGDSLVSSAEGNETERWIVKGGPGSPPLTVVAIYRGDAKGPVTLTIKETKRKTRFANDLETLLKIIKVIAEGRDIEAPPQPAYRLLVRTHHLKEVRSTVAVTATLPAGDTKPAKEITAQRTLVVGPVEHWFLSADLVVTKVTEVKYDDATKTLQSKDTPTHFFGGLNFSLGDVASSRTTFDADGLALKALVGISSRPLDELGVAIAYRFPDVHVLGFDLNTLSVFGGPIWSKVDGQDASGAVLKRDHYSGKLRAGISFNLDRALDFLKK
jgi:hypothetical protein